ncbi:hypothetical protein OPIT5_00250 (plasmid) [Opitutaceae bacterium TAV5]|nr:hypothetical protein OPIT5_00250 [Opitutaceae bacterium TAV5]
MRIHGITLLTLRTLHHAIEHPVAVFQSETVGDSVVVMLDRNDSEGRPIFVAMGLNREVNAYLAHIIASVYGASFNQRIARWFEESGRVLYYHQKKSQQWFHSVGLQYPELETIAGGEKVVSDIGDVKPKPAGPETVSDGLPLPVPEKHSYSVRRSR